jgi:hypothetical protein
MATTQGSLVDHIEKYLGKIEGAWTRSPEHGKMDFHVLSCVHGQIDQARTFCTVGLGNFPLVSAVSNRVIRHELLILAPESFGNRNIPALLQQLGLGALKRKSAYLRGEVIEGASAIFKERSFSAFYAAIPNIISQDFSVYRDEQGVEVVFVWMVPIMPAEAKFTRAHGWSKFEDLLQSQNADMVDFDRQSFVPETS